MKVRSRSVSIMKPVEAPPPRPARSAWPCDRQHLVVTLPANIATKQREIRRGVGEFLFSPLATFRRSRSSDELGDADRPQAWTTF